MSALTKDLILGVDVGTTSVKMSVFDASRQTIIANSALPYQFSNDNAIQQNVSTILRRTQQCMRGLSGIEPKRIAVISMCGQMHGCLLWNSSAVHYCPHSSTFSLNESANSAANNAANSAANNAANSAANNAANGSTNFSVSDLYTWRDSRCTATFIASLPEPDCYEKRISSGFGCATILWLQTHCPQLLARFSKSGTIMDFLVAIICNLDRTVMSTQNAMSWGYFDPINHSWNEQILKSHNFPIELLPRVVRAGTVAGLTAVEWLGIEANTPVMAALGDLQCACFAALKHCPHSAVLNISTSMQLSVLTRNECIPVPTNDSIRYIPYFEDRYLAVAASLNGGNVLQSFVNLLRNIVQQIANVTIGEQSVWEKLFELAETRDNQQDSDLRVRPTLFGERHDCSLKASVSNISEELEVSQLMAATCKGLIDNIFEMMPIEFIANNQIQTLIGTGSALLRNPILKRALQTKLNIPVIYIDSNDADVGACYAAYAYFYHSKDLNHNQQFGRYTT